MNNLKKGMRVHAKSKFLEGTGEILYIDYNSFFCPVAVKLDNAIDQHQYYRFEVTEVKELVKLGGELVVLNEKVVELEKAARAFLLVGSSTRVKPKIPEVRKEYVIDNDPPVNITVRLKEKIKGYSFKAGEVFKASGTGSVYDTCYYLYDLKTGKLRGCMLKGFFEVIENVESAPCEVLEVPNTKVTEVDEEAEIVARFERRYAKLKEMLSVRKAKTDAEKLEAKGQLTLFDVMGV